MRAIAHRVRGQKAKSSVWASSAGAGYYSPTNAVGVAKSAAQRGISQSKRVDKSSVAGHVIAYSTALGVDAFVQRIANATPMELIEVERNGVQGRFIKNLSIRVGVPAVRVCENLGVPKATLERRVAEGVRVTGAAGQAALGTATLLAKARAIVDNSTALAANDFDSARWFGRWIELAQPALGGRKPAELIAVPTGRKVVSGLLGAMESGAYQ